MTDLSSSVIWELRRHLLFEAMSDDDLTKLIAIARPVVVPARKIIFAQDDESDGLYIVLSGRVKISVHSSGGKETILTFLSDHDPLGEIGALDGEPRSASATAMTDCRLLKISRTDMLAFLAVRPAVSLQIIAALAKRLRATNAYLENLATAPAPARLASALLRLAREHGIEETSGAVTFDMKVSQSALGSLSGLARENVNRQLKQWESDGVLRVTGGEIEILDARALKDALLA